MAILAGPGRFLDSACALLADVFQLSSQKSAFKARTTIQLNLVDFSVAVVAVWAGPGCFLDPGCALLVDVVQVSSQKSGFKAGNQATIFTEKINQTWLNCGWQFGGSRTLFGFGLRIACWCCSGFKPEISLQNGHKNSTKFG